MSIIFAVKKSAFYKTILILTSLTLFFSQLKCTAPVKPVEAKNGMVVSASTIASEVGVKILKEGGNAVDAAVATGFALAVTLPYAGNIGGGGFMVIHLSDGTNTTIDYREKAPLSAFREMYLDEEGNVIPRLSLEGALSVGVPGSVAGMIYALKKYGTMPLEKVIQPAIDLAEKGWVLDESTANGFKKFVDVFKKYPSTYKVFTKNGIPYEEGDVFKQPDLAHTLELIRDKGADGFYKGKVADLIVKQMKEMNGLITYEDLENYNPVERNPVTGNYRGYEIVSMPPPSSGGIALIELLNILENFNLNEEGWGSSLYIHRLVEAMKYVYADRTVYLGDADFYPVPVKELISKEYAKEIFKKIGDAAVPSTQISAGNFNKHYESPQTTHYSVYDANGNAVSVTTTLNSEFGSKVVVEGAGFLLNNEMNDFVEKPGVPNQFGLMGGEANSIEPEKRMLSSMTPTIVLKEDKPYIIVGSPGGSRIITTVLQVILNCIEFNMNIQKAINSPRIHHQWMPDTIFCETGALDDDTKDKLTEMGYSIVEGEITIGMAEGIMIDNKSKIIYGASDTRGTGAAAGY